MLALYQDQELGLPVAMLYRIADGFDKAGKIFAQRMKDTCEALEKGRSRLLPSKINWASDLSNGLPAGQDVQMRGLAYKNRPCNCHNMLTR